MHFTSWVLWALLLVAQNFAFTFVSRSRNSGSLSRHMVAAIFSNGIWFASQLIVVSTFMNILSGKYGIRMAIAAGLFYTAFTLAGSLLAHGWALRTEKGKSSVGASKKYVQITYEEWARVQAFCFPNDYPASMTAPPALPDSETSTMPRVTKSVLETKARAVQMWMSAAKEGR